MTAYLSGIDVTDDGYLLFGELEAQGDGTPAVLESAEQLWLKFHPHCEEIDFQPFTSESRSVGEKREQLSDMSNKLNPVLEDIDRMRDRHRFLTRKQRDERDRLSALAESSNRGKVQSLEREQEAHQRKELKQEVPSEATDYSQANLRVVKTLNSIRLVFPMLIKLLNHEDKDNKDIELEGETLSKGNKLWMIGDYVYDEASTKNFNNIKMFMSWILIPLLPQNEIDDIMTGEFNEWDKLLARFLEKSMAPEPPPNPLDLLSLGDEQLRRAREHDAAMMECIHEGRHDENQDLFERAVNKLKQRLDQVLGRRFPGCRLQVYGSCLSDLSTGKASDVDISIHIPALEKAKKQFEAGSMTPKKYESELKRHVYCVRGNLGDNDRDFKDLQAVARARVPVVKGCYLFAENPHTQCGSLCFDICFFNDIAVRNSILLKNYTDVDPVAKNLMLAVKMWAKDNHVCSAADERLSAYAWVILTIFYLQQIGLLPNLQSEDLMKKANFKCDFNDPLNRVNALNTSFVPWKRVKAANAWRQPDELKDMPMCVLLYGFFHFLTKHFPTAFMAVSIRTDYLPKAISGKSTLSFFSIEDPFETYESHCPHDLAGPACPHGQAEIWNLLQHGEKYLKSALRGEKQVATGELWLGPYGIRIRRVPRQVSVRIKTQPSEDGAKGTNTNSDAPSNKVAPDKNKTGNQNTGKKKRNGNRRNVKRAPTNQPTTGRSEQVPTAPSGNTQQTKSKGGKKRPQQRGKGGRGNHTRQPSGQSSGESK